MSIFILIELFMLWSLMIGRQEYTGILGFNGYLRMYGHSQFFLVSYIEKIVGTGLLAYLLMIIISVARSLVNTNLISESSSLKINKKIIAINIISLICLLIFYYIIKNPEIVVNNPRSLKAIFLTFSPIIWLVYIYSVFNLIFPIRIFINITKDNKLLLIILVFIIVFMRHSAFLDVLVNYWANLLLRPTIVLASIISNFMGLDAHVFSDTPQGIPIFGTDNFIVAIEAGCSGYEGLTLSTTLLGFYCYLQRKFLRFPQALVIIPFSGTCIFLLNSFRLVLLVAIGHYWSSDIALNGFHSVAGWLNLIATLIISILLLNSIPFFRKSSHIANCDKRRDNSQALLLPLVGLIIGSLLIRAVTADFQWLYPIPIFISIGLFIFIKGGFEFPCLTPKIFSVGIGVLVFLLWIYLIPPDHDKSLSFYHEIMSVPLWIALPWLACRIFGASIVVPVAEEFAFRGYMLPQFQILIENSLNHTKFFSFRLISIKFYSALLSLSLTSLLFGVLHSDMLAGLLAGFAYGLAYLRRRSLIDAVVAHSVTNFLLAIDVIYFGNWSYW